MNSTKGKIQVYTGNGKGKTTAAFGLAFRACGQGLKVVIIQFLKGNSTYGEIISSKKFEDCLSVYQFGKEEFILPNQIKDIDFKEAKNALDKAEEIINKDEADVIILDEINVALFFNLIKLGRVLNILSNQKKAEIILTGRNAAKEILELADLVTEMKEIKHYYKNNISARKGIEF